jgi:hypothetical protein
VDVKVVNPSLGDVNTQTNETEQHQCVLPGCAIKTQQELLHASEIAGNMNTGLWIVSGIFFATTTAAAGTCIGGWIPGCGFALVSLAATVWTAAEAGEMSKIDNYLTAGAGQIEQNHFTEFTYESRENGDYYRDQNLTYDLKITLPISSLLMLTFFTNKPFGFYIYSVP